MDLTRFEHFLLLLHRHNLILQCKQYHPTLCESPSPSAPTANSRMFPFCSQISFPTRSRRQQSAAARPPPGERARRSGAPSRSISPCKARRARRVHLGRAGSAARRRQDRDRRHLRRVGGSGERGHARDGSPAADRTRRPAARRFLARVSRRRPPRKPAARRGSSGCSLSFRATACGSPRCLACCRPTISTRSTSTRSKS